MRWAGVEGAALKRLVPGTANAILLAHPANVLTELKMDLRRGKIAIYIKLINGKGNRVLVVTSLGNMPGYD